MHASLRFVPIAVLVALAAACGEKGDGDPPGMGGTGGSSSSGGSDGSGGSGGVGGSGGTSTSSGTGGTGDGGSAGAPVEPMLVYGFDEDLQGWTVIYTASKEGVDPVEPSDIELDWAEDEGNPGGALRAEIPFTDAGQYIGFGLDLTADPLDLTGRTITVWVKIVSGVGDPTDLMTNPAGAKIYAKSGEAYVYAAGSFNNITEIGEWLEIDFELAYPDYVDETNGIFDPSEVREIGVQIDTGGTSMSAQPGVIMIDGVSY